MRVRSIVFLSCLASLGLAACGDDTGNIAMVDPSVCESGLQWVGGDSGDDRMHPGGDCISCHAMNDGPEFTAAGTVYDSVNQADECFGLAGVTVTITDAAMNTITLTTNEAGNFYTQQPIMFPYTASVSDGAGGMNVMMTAQPLGTCNGCHTRTGAAGAPGRIFIP